jgi:hypothetical protein
MWDTLVTTGNDDKSVLNEAQRLFINSIVFEIPMCDLEMGHCRPSLLGMMDCGKPTTNNGYEMRDDAAHFALRIYVVVEARTIIPAFSI